MKIAQVITTLGTGGAEKLVAEISEILNKMDNVSVKVIMIKDYKGVPYKILRDKRVEIIELKYKKLFNPLIAFDLYKYTKDCDIVHTHTYYAQLYASMFISSKKLITTEHNTFNRRRGKKLFKILDYFMYKRYKKIICISNEAETELNKWLKSTIHKTEVVYNGININAYKDAEPLVREEMGISDEDVVLLCVGRLEEQKNHINLIASMKYVNPNVKLLITGDGSLRDDLEKCIKDNGLEHRVRLLGNRNDVNRLLKMSDIFILPSLWEGFPLAGIEAAAAGLPLIISNVSGLKDIFINSVKVEPNNIEDIAEKINYVLQNLEIIKQNKNDIEEYSIENMVNKYLKVYSNCFNIDL